LTPTEQLAVSSFAVANQFAPRAELARDLYPHRTPSQVAESIAAAEAERRADQLAQTILAGHAEDLPADRVEEQDLATEPDNAR
jgi:hypothetical protein